MLVPLLGSADEEDRMVCRKRVLEGNPKTQLLVPVPLLAAGCVVLGKSTDSLGVSVSSFLTE